MGVCSRHAGWAERSRRATLPTGHPRAHLMMQSWKVSRRGTEIRETQKKKKKKEGDRARRDKRECVLSADQRRLSLKFLLFTFVPYGANYV